MDAKRLEEIEQRDYIDETQLDIIVAKYVQRPVDDADRELKMMVLSLVSDLRNCRVERDQQQAELKEWQDAALIVYDVCGGSGFDKPGTGYDSTCDCAGGYIGRYTPQQMADKLFQQQAEIERFNRAYEVLRTKMIEYGKDYTGAVFAVVESQRIKEGKEGEQG